MHDSQYVWYVSCCITGNTQSTPTPGSFLSQCSVTLDLGCKQCFGAFCRIAQGTSLNLFPLFGHAVIVQSPPGRFPCVGRDRSHQEADQVISIISFNFTFRDKFIFWRGKKKQLSLSVAFTEWENITRYCSPIFLKSNSRIYTHKRCVFLKFCSQIGLNPHDWVFFKDHPSMRQVWHITSWQIMLQHQPQTATFKKTCSLDSCCSEANKNRKEKSLSTLLKPCHGGNGVMLWA